MYRKNNIYRDWYYLWFQVPTGGLKTYPLLNWGGGEGVDLVYKDKTEINFFFLLWVCFYYYFSCSFGSLISCSSNKWIFLILLCHNPTWTSPWDEYLGSWGWLPLNFLVLSAKFCYLSSRSFILSLITSIRSQADLFNLLNLIIIL